VLETGSQRWQMRSQLRAPPRHHRYVPRMQGLFHGPTSKSSSQIGECPPFADGRPCQQRWPGLPESSFESARSAGKCGKNVRLCSRHEQCRLCRRLASSCAGHAALRCSIGLARACRGSSRFPSGSACDGRQQGGSLPADLRSRGDEREPGGRASTRTYPIAVQVPFVFRVHACLAQYEASGACVGWLDMA